MEHTFLARKMIESIYLGHICTFNTHYVEIQNLPLIQYNIRTYLCIENFIIGDNLIFQYEIIEVRKNQGYIEKWRNREYYL